MLLCCAESQEPVPKTMMRDDDLPNHHGQCIEKPDEKKRIRDKYYTSFPNADREVDFCWANAYFIISSLEKRRWGWPVHEIRSKLSGLCCSIMFSTTANIGVFVDTNNHY